MSPRFLLGHASFRCGPRFFGLSPCSQSPAATRDNGSSLDELPQGVIRGGRRGRTCNSLSAPDFTFRLPRHMAGSPCLSIPGHFPTIISLLITDRIGQHWPGPFRETQNTVSYIKEPDRWMTSSACGTVTLYLHPSARGQSLQF